MAQGMIHSVRPSKSGKSLTVMVDASRYQAKLDSGLGNAVGKTITFDPKPQQLQDGGTIYWINEFTISGPASVPSVAAPKGPGAAISPAPVSPYQPMCSNLAAALIAAGKEPSDLSAWFNAAKDLLDGRERMPGDDDLGPSY
jgi:hypothetical protein